MASRTRPRRRAPAFYGGSDSEDYRPSRARDRPNYVVDISSDDENLGGEGSDVVFTVSLPRQPSPRRTPTRSSKRKSQTSKQNPYAHYKRHKVLGAPLKQNSSPRNEEHAILPGGKIPPWQTLEHAILTNILKKAAYPLYQGYLRPNASIRWLVGLSYLSESFHRASMSALLTSPPLTNGSGILGLLKLDQDTLSTNYRMKPRKLVVEAQHSLVQKAGKICLPELVSLMPLLESLQIVSHYDEIQAIGTHPSIARKNYLYESSLFEALETSCPRLKEFAWNGRFATGIPELIDTIISAHTRLSGLTSIILVNLNIAGKTPIEERELLQKRLLAGLNKLPELQHLDITNCNVFGNFATLASLQTSQLKSLTITACPSLTSSGLEIFLNTKGASLEHLRLIGCQACHGAFLSRLGGLCATLQTLQIDLSFSDVSSWNDISAHFDDFQPDGPIFFPSSLIDLSLINLRKIDSAQLEATLTSLVETDLPSLRSLSIKVILTSDYRQRAQIRREWGHKLEQVFLRQALPPVLYWRSQNRLPVGGDELAKEALITSNLDESKKRQSSRVSKSIFPAAQNTVSEFVKTNGTPLKRQGLCELVELRIDDQRPAKDQYTSLDFLDDEPSGDDMYQD
jgi:hypothetical protein